MSLVEASHRVGGRMLTHYGEGWYGDLGAMRFPVEHVLVNGVRRKYYSLHQKTGLNSMNFPPNNGILVVESYKYFCPATLIGRKKPLGEK